MGLPRRSPSQASAEFLLAQCAGDLQESPGLHADHPISTGAEGFAGRKPLRDAAGPDRFFHTACA